ncbi:MAG TPA: dephospho-CoA kinase [Erysipelothrix sp.]|jgi:dephospho-CoA kinase|nr:dephospho-CoA kinase [Erysipelothrix sp.]
MSKTKKIAITGLIGSGKSSVLAYLRSRGYTVFSADEYVSNLYETDKELAKKIQSLTSIDVLSDGYIDKIKLKEIFFLDLNLKQEIEEIVHQVVYDAIFNDKIEATFYEIPLLFETNRQAMFDEVILVVTSRENQFERLMKFRHMGQDEIEQRLNAQISVDEKIRVSDVLLINNSSLEHLYYQIDQYLERRGL